MGKTNAPAFVGDLSWATYHGLPPTTTHQATLKLGLGANLAGLDHSTCQCESEQRKGNVRLGHDTD